MYSGFINLCNNMLMNVMVVLFGMGWNVVVQCDIDCIVVMWIEFCQKYVVEGLFLFGYFMVVDVFYVLVVSCFVMYGVCLLDVVKVYVDYIFNLFVMQEWIDGVCVEYDFFVDDELYCIVLDEDMLVVVN